MQDFAYFKSLYPAAFKQMQLCVEEVCDEMEYKGSPIYDEYPDRLFLEKLTKRALEKWQGQNADVEKKMQVPIHMKAAAIADEGRKSDEINRFSEGGDALENGSLMSAERKQNFLTTEEISGKQEKNLVGASIQPHVPGNDVWYGPFRGEQQGTEAGYTVWEATEPNLTAQERRPWSPPPGPRPGGAGNPWGPPPPPPGPGNPWGPPPPPPGPGNPWGPPPPPPGPGNPWGPPPPPPGPRPGKAGNSWWAGNCLFPGCSGRRETPIQDFLQVLLMNELQERRRCKKC